MESNPQRTAPSPAELEEAHAYANRINADYKEGWQAKIETSNQGPTGYRLGDDSLNLGKAIAPAIHGTTPDEQLSVKAAVAHEMVGHREAQIVGQGADDRMLDWAPPTPTENRANMAQGVGYEDAQASYRAALNAPDLSTEDRMALIRDGNGHLDQVKANLASLGIASPGKQNEEMYVWADKSQGVAGAPPKQPYDPDVGVAQAYMEGSRDARTGLPMMAADDAGISRTDAGTKAYLQGHGDAFGEGQGVHKVLMPQPPSPDQERDYRQAAMWPKTDPIGPASPGPHPSDNYDSSENTDARFWAEHDDYGNRIPGYSGLTPEQLQQIHDGTANPPSPLDYRQQEGPLNTWERAAMFEWSRKHLDGIKELGFIPTLKPKF
jgi:hypothetical protein